jgi:hypothetical protein
MNTDTDKTKNDGDINNVVDDITDISANPAVEAAEAQAQVDTDDIVTLSTGVRVRLASVSASLIDEVRSRVKDPPVPIMHDDEKGRDMPNPHDPTFLREMQDAEDRRNKATTDAMILFGVKLVDPLPENDDWITELQFLHIEVDKSSPLALEFAYKKFIAVGAPDYPLLLTASSPVTEEEVKRARESFPGDEGRDTDMEPTAS